MPSPILPDILVSLHRRRPSLGSGMVAALTELIKPDEDRIMIIDMGPTEGGVEGRIEFLGVHHEDKEEKFILV